VYASIWAWPGSAHGCRHAASSARAWFIFAVSVGGGLTDRVRSSLRARFRLDSGRFSTGLDFGRFAVPLLFDLPFSFFSLANLAYFRANHVFVSAI
jgi:hypothetical protein